MFKKWVKDMTFVFYGGTTLHFDMTTTPENSEKIKDILNSDRTKRTEFVKNGGTHFIGIHIEDLLDLLTAGGLIL